MLITKHGDKNNLKTRYLLWLYKTAKEELERIDRKFTQIEIDEFMLNKLKIALKSMPSPPKNTCRKLLKEFSGYIANKKKVALELKFDKSGNTKLAYKFLSLKLSSIESAVKQFLGQGKLREIKKLYHQEMLRRILEERQHK